MMAVENETIGLVAGRGVYPLLFCRGARAHGVASLPVIGVRGDADPALAEEADSLDWVYAGQLGRTIKLLKKHGADRVVFAGQIKPGRLFKGLRPDLRTVKLLAGLRRRNAESIFSALAAEFERDGITVLPATTFLEPALAPAGTIGRRRLSGKARADVEYGVSVARRVSAMDIGQTVVVKEGTVLAVEAFEGTDRAIRRGGELGRGGVTVVKVAKPGQDMRFDVPCIGMRSVESLIAAGASVVAVQAGSTLLLEREKVVAALDDAGIVLYGFTVDEAAE
jgi:DUF1009 family protein